MALGSHIFDVEPIQDEMAVRGARVKKCLCPPRRDVLKCWDCYLLEVREDGRLKRRASGNAGTDR